MLDNDIIICYNVDGGQRDAQECHTKKEVIFMTAKETEILASIIQIIQSMSAQSRRDLLLMGRGILLGEQNRKRDDHAEKS